MAGMFRRVPTGVSMNQERVILASPKITLSSFLVAERSGFEPEVER